MTKLKQMKVNESDIQSIMVIDDDRDEFLLILDAMKQIDPDITVYFADSCEEAIKFRNYKVDLVLLDINMPQHDGFSWLRSIREHGYLDLPIVMYTNSMSPLHITKAYTDGANLYYVKPDNFKRLINGLSKLLSMDWSQPDKITQNYHHSGKSLTFN